MHHGPFPRSRRKIHPYGELEPEVEAFPENSSTQEMGGALIKATCLQAGPVVAQVNNYLSVATKGQSFQLQLQFELPLSA